MRFLFAVTTSTVVLAILISAVAKAEGPRTTKIQAQSQKLAAVESQLTPNDLQALDYYLGGIDSVLSHYQQNTTAFICVSNGQTGSYERFKIMDPMTAESFGGETALDTCQKLIAVQNANLICTSNGQYGSYERFTPFDLSAKKEMGGSTDLNTCQTLVTRARPTLVCLSNGQYGSYERFSLYNRVLGQVLGGDTTLSQCLSSIPN